MTLAMDPEVRAAFEKMAAAIGARPRPPVGDCTTRRRNGEEMFGVWSRMKPHPVDVSTQDFRARSADGVEILLRLFCGSGDPPGSAAIYVHGGGMILGSVDVYDDILRRLVSASGVPLLAVDYRRAPEHPHPTPVHDCHAALRWLFEHAGDLGVDPGRIGIMGDSAGGGLAAATVLVARDRGGAMPAKQILVYPMLDDRNTQPVRALVPFATWNWDDNRTGWGALLGDRAGTDGVDAHAAPARAADLANLPSTYLEVGQLDIFCAESVAYAQRLIAAQVPTELHVHPGVPHGFELFAPDADVSRRATADRARALRSL
jgi:acetyl esterase/lipase